jgi:hypothetical protein
MPRIWRSFIIFIRTFLKIEITGLHITDTDYFESTDYEQGIAWCVVEHGVWHLLVPSPPIHPPSMVETRPVTDRQDRDGWRWRASCHLPLFGRYIRPRRPSLPEPLTRYERTAVFYHAIMRGDKCKGSSFFSSVQQGVQIWAKCPLWILRDKSRADLLRNKLFGLSRRWNP